MCVVNHEKVLDATAASVAPRYLGDFSPRHKVWDKRKDDADYVAEAYALAKDEGLKKHGVNVAGCSETVVLTPLDEGSTGGYRASSWKCRERHCPICQSARVRKLHTAFSGALPTIMEKVPDGVFLMLTLTLKNCDIVDLRTTVSEMNQAWRRLSARKEFRIVKGWIRSTEVTRAPNATAHPHFHCLLLVPKSYANAESCSYIKQNRWAELWQDCLRLDYKPTVDVRKVGVFGEGLSEVVKVATYSIKPAKVLNHPKWFHEFHRQVSGLRFLAMGGVIKSVVRTLKLGTVAEEQDIAAESASESLEQLESVDAEGVVSAEKMQVVGVEEAVSRKIYFNWDRQVRRYRCRFYRSVLDQQRVSALERPPD